MTTGENKLFHLFIHEICFRLHTPRLSRRLLKKFADTDISINDIVDSLKENQYYLKFIEKLLATLPARPADSTPESKENALLRFGMQKAKNQLCALQLARQLDPTIHPDSTGKGESSSKSDATPETILKYALKAEEAVINKRPSFSDAAFGAGLMFDALAGIALKNFKSSKFVIEWIEEVFAHSLRSAKIGIEIAKLIPNGPPTKYVFAACLLHDVGRVALSILDTSYLDFVGRCKKEDLPSPVRRLFEIRRYGMPHEAFSAICVSFFPVFRIVTEPVLFHHEPFLLAGANKDNHALASTIHIATNMANNLVIPGNTSDPVIQKWKTPALVNFSIDTQKLITIAAMISRSQ